MTAITDILTIVINGIYEVIKNHGWSIIIFTVLVRIVLMPLDISSRKGMRKMAKIQPQITALQKKYANDKAKLQQKQSELMRREHYSPLSGCLPLLIQMPILFAMFAAMRAIANELIVNQVFTFLAGETPSYEGWLWVKNIWSADSFFAAVAPSADAIKAIPLDVWKHAFLNKDLAAFIIRIQETIPNFNVELFEANAKTLNDFITKIIMPVLEAKGSVYSVQTALLPAFGKGINLFITTLPVFQYFNGLLILPVLAGASQVLMTKINPQAAGQQPAAPGQQAGMGNFMKYFFPLFSVYICLTSNAAFALYWVTSNLIATAMSYGINMYYDRKEKLVSQQQLQEGTLK